MDCSLHSLTHTHCINHVPTQESRTPQISNKPINHQSTQKEFSLSLSNYHLDTQSNTEIGMDRVVISWWHSIRRERNVLVVIIYCFLFPLLCLFSLFCTPSLFLHTIKASIFSPPQITWFHFLEIWILFSLFIFFWVYLYFHKDLIFHYYCAVSWSGS